MPGALLDAMRVAACCDLRTVDEAVTNAELHVMQFKSYDEIPAYLKELREERLAWTSGDLIPREIIDTELAAMDAALAPVQNVPMDPPSFFSTP